MCWPWGHLPCKMKMIWLKSHTVNWFFWPRYIVYGFTSYFVLLCQHLLNRCVLSDFSDVFGRFRAATHKAWTHKEATAHPYFGAHKHSHVTYIHMAGAHMAGEHMAGASHVTHISRSQIKFILLLSKLSICLPRKCSEKRLHFANPIVPSERSRPLPASSAAHGRWCCTLLWYCWSSLCSNLENDLSILFLLATLLSCPSDYLLIQEML